MEIKTNNIIGISWMVLHCFLIASMTAMVRVISDQFNVLQIVFFHNLVAFILIALFVFATGGAKNLKTQKFKLHISRAVLGVISLSMYFYAFTVIPLTQARGIALTGPLVSTLFAVLFLKEKTDWPRNMALVVGFLGALLILKPGGDNFYYESFLVVAAVVMWAVIDIIIKMLSKSEETSTQLFYLTGLMTILSAPGAIYFWTQPVGAFQWLWLIAIGVVFLFNVMAVFNAFKYADVSVVMPFDFSGMVFTTIFAYMLFAEVIDITTAIGSLIIVMSGVYIVRRENKKSRQIQEIALKTEI